MYKRTTYCGYIIICYAEKIKAKQFTKLCARVCVCSMLMEMECMICCEMKEILSGRMDGHTWPGILGRFRFGQKHN